MKSKVRWVPLQPANLIKKLTKQDVEDAMAAMPDKTYEEVEKLLEQEVWGVEYWVNDLYQVAKRVLKQDGVPIGMVQLNIRRRDGKPIFRDWRHFQWIKNQLIGEECEAVEIYPAESRLVDTSNKYHLWCFTDPTYRLPFGMQTRDVIDSISKKPGHRQRRI
jgi:hypothetical protein